MKEVNLNDITLGSLFDGIGGWQIAAVRNGIVPLWSSEIEPFPLACTKKHFPDTEQLGDITKINGADIHPVDIICAGSPCQDISLAGNRSGLKGARSGLFTESIRILREMRGATNGEYPKFFVWENVVGALSSNQRHDFQTVLSEITETNIPMPKSGRWANAGMVRSESVGLAWRILDSEYWGVPQKRRRIFLIAGFGTWGRNPEILFEPTWLRGTNSTFAESRKKTTATPGTSTPESDSYLVRMRHGVIGRGGVGPLVQKNVSGTLSTSNDQILFTEGKPYDRE